ncbi:hypothetical protein ACFWQC_11705 [Nocardioides sp. NPDC058538]|uniref:hypothetical protein n=1 Tax=Nocardioides sp. NPDC058538 TaxID=3346542 RepID=UPI0036693EFE
MATRHAGVGASAPTPVTVGLGDPAGEGWRGWTVVVEQQLADAVAHRPEVASGMGTTEW